jgi:hypothetical protein
MKRIIYIFAFALISSMAVSACTEEEVTPTAAKTDTNGGGGASQDRIY